MRITIMGAGCIGGLIGAALEVRTNGNSVTFVDRGAQLRALQSGGISISGPDSAKWHAAPLQVVSDTTGCGAQDVVFLGLKAHQITPALDAIAPLLGPDTVVVTLQNGIPWWYFHGLGSTYDGRVVEGADPGGRIGKVIDPAQVVGCVAYPAVSRPAPGKLLHVEGNRFPVGAPDGVESAKVHLVSELLESAGFKSPILPDLRAEIWLKAIGNMSFNPISALTQATLVDICEHPDTRMLARRIMSEGEAVANSLGVSLRVSIDRRIDGARRVGKHRSSMLQDTENGEQLEHEALVSAVSELGALTGTPTPATDTVLALTRLLNQVIVNERVAIVRQPQDGT